MMHPTSLIQIQTDLENGMTGYNYNCVIQSVQMVEKGYIVVFNCEPKRHEDRLGRYQRLAFFEFGEAGRLHNKSEIILG